MASAPALDQRATAVLANPTWPEVMRIIRDLESQEGLTADLRDRVLAAIETAARALLSPSDKPHDFIFSSETFLLPRGLALRSGRLIEHDYWTAKRGQMLGYLRHRLDDPTFSHVLTSLLICESILEGRAAALGALLRRLAQAGAAQFRKGLPSAREAYFNLIREGGWLDGDLAPAEEALADAGRDLSALSGAQVRTWALAIVDLFLIPRAPEPWLDLLFRRVVLAVLDRAASDMDEALLEASWMLDFLVSRDYLRSAEGAERFAQIMGSLSRAQYAVGAAARQIEGRRNLDLKAVVRQDQTVRIGFIVHSGARLAHAENLLTFLRGLRELQNPGFVPLVYVATTGGETAASPLGDALAALDVPLRWPNSNAGHPIVWLRHAVETDGLAAVVFVSSPLYMAFAAGYRAAPTLLWWAMKYHGLMLDGIDGYLTVGNFFDNVRMIDGRPWRSTRMALPELRDLRVLDEAAKLRANAGVAPGQVLFACIGREEKMLEWAYIDAIGKVLEQCPGARFVWTGRSALTDKVQVLLEKRYIAGRCACVGWLKNTRVLAEALDVYLDTFPFASGHTGYEAMAAGKPVLVLTTPEALESSTATSLVPAIRGEIGSPHDQADVRAIFTDSQGQSLLPYVDTVDDYVAWGIRFGHEPGFRSAVGLACKTFVERYARNERACAETTVRHIRAVVLEKVPGAGTARTPG